MAEFKHPAVADDMIKVSIGQYSSAMDSVYPTAGGYTAVYYDNTGEPVSCQSFNANGAKISYRVSRSVWLKMRDPK